MENFAKIVQTAGVVGTGRAGFPTYKKIDAKVEIVIANGAECEPLYAKDLMIMENYAKEIIDGMQQLMDHMGARNGIVAIIK